MDAETRKWRRLALSLARVCRYVPGELEHLAKGAYGEVEMAGGG